MARNQIAIEGLVSTESSASARGENNQSKSRNEESAPLGRFAIRDRVRELRRVRAGDLVPNPKNWRRHPAAQVNALHGVMAEVGFADALLVREMSDGRLMLIDGHLRAETLPESLLPVLVLDVSEQEADKILATFDPVGSMAESDSQRIRALLETVRSDNDAVRQLLRRTAGDRLWEMLHPDEVQEVEVSPDRAAELRRKWRTEFGQLWGIGAHRIRCGDCRHEEGVATLWADDAPRARMIWTDCPYGVGYAAKNRFLNRTDRGNRIQKEIVNDHLPEAETGALFRDALVVAAKHCGPGASIYASVPGGRALVRFITALTEAGFDFRSTLVWVKDQFVIGMSDYHYRHELILYGWLNNGAHFWSGGRTRDSVFEVNRPQVSDLHPTQKPVELIARMISNSSRPGELVYDPFCGSGSTILAAHQLGRVGFGCEIDPAYVAVSLERLSLLGLKPELMVE